MTDEMKLLTAFIEASGFDVKLIIRNPYTQEDVRIGELIPAPKGEPILAPIVEYSVTRKHNALYKYV